MISCEKCIYSEVLTEIGGEYSILLPDGSEATRVHRYSALMCRFFPPINGEWTTVTKEDWCGQFESSETSDSEHVPEARVQS